MKINELHRWDVTYREAAAIQEELRGKLILRDDGLADPVRTVAGATGFPNRSAWPISPSTASGWSGKIEDDP
jgi:hypothetical protein